MVIPMNITTILKEKPFTSRTQKISWLRSQLNIYYNGKEYGSVTNKELGHDITALLNTAYQLGASSGSAYASTMSPQQLSMTAYEKNDSYTPYMLEVYKETKSAEDNNYDYSIAFEECVVRSYKNISRKALANMVEALNGAHELGFNKGIEIIKQEQQYQTQNSPDFKQP